MSSLPFRIVFRSSEDRKFLAQSLSSITVPELKSPEVSRPSTSHWLSEAGSSYPEVLIISFDKVVHLTQVQLLSHEYAIASKIELFVCEFPITSIVGPVETLEYKRLGHFSLDTNERSNWQSRELKSVFVDVNCGLLKLLLHAPHKNRFNLRHQVGIFSVCCLGDITDTDEASVSASPVILSGIDDITRGLLVECQSDWKDAIKDINPEGAKLVQERIDSLMKSGAVILDLETRKQIAANSEDYDEAKRLKLEIERYRQLQKEPSQRSFVDSITSLWKGGSVEETHAQPPVNHPAIQSVSPANKPVLQPVVSGSQPVLAVSQPVLAVSQPVLQPVLPVMPLLPPLAGDALPAYFERDYPQLIESLGSDTVTLLMSRDWKLREKGILSVQGRVADKTIEYGVGWIIRKLINDKIINIYLAVCELIKGFAHRATPSFGETAEMAFIHMVEQRMCDSNKRVIDTTIATILAMVPRLVSVNLAYHYLLKGPFSKQNVHVRAQVLVGLFELHPQHKLDLVIATLGDWTQNVLFSDSVGFVLKHLAVRGTDKVQLAIDGLSSEQKRVNLHYELTKVTQAASPSEEMGQCEFCLRIDRRFLKPDLLDMHYWEQCPNLIECHFCEQIVELTALSEHRLKECQT